MLSNGKNVQQMLTIASKCKQMSTKVNICWHMLSNGN